MLLVDDHQAEVVEADRVLDQRVRADRKMNRSGGKLRLHLPPLLRRRRAGQQRDPEPRRLEQPADGDEVLLGEDFGRRHERDLKAVLHRHQRRHQRHDGLAGTDVPLQQPVHRLRPLHVLDDLGDHLLLIAGELERQDAPRRLADVVGDDDRPRLSAPPPTAAGAAPARAETGRTPRRSAAAAPAIETR